MSPTVALITQFFAICTLLADGLVVILLGAYIAKKINPTIRFFDSVLDFFAARAVLFSFLVALLGMLTSLFYSELVGFPPCVLCWWQRVFLYPQVLLLGGALLRKGHRTSENNSIILSIIGAGFAIYNVYLQFGGNPLLPCASTGPSCSQRLFLEFGYITIPTMSLTAFALIITFLAVKKSKPRADQI